MKNISLHIINSLLAILILAGCGGESQSERHAEKIRELESRLSKLENEKSEENQSEVEYYEPQITYSEVRIGDQVWMAENLNVDRFRNGDPIPYAESAEEWKRAEKSKMPAWCYPNNDPINGAKYGKLYNWYAVNDPRGLAPISWHVPSDEEWTVLIDNLGGHEIAGAKMKSTSGWFNNGNGNNSSGFSGLPGGYRICVNYSFGLIGRNGFWWTSSEDFSEDISNPWEEESAYYVWSFILFSTSKEVTLFQKHKEDGLSVRCIRD